MLIELRTRADAYRGIEEAGYVDFCNALDQEPVA